MEASVNVNPYLMFNGRCEEALEFYKSAVGASDAHLIRFSEAPPDAGAPGQRPPPDKVMHASFRIGDSTILASDGECGGTTRFDGFSLSVNAASDAEARKIFDALAKGGQVRMPLGKTFWTSSFGMLADKFGVGWMVSVEHK
jgi:PhnB protein